MDDNNRRDREEDKDDYKAVDKDANKEFVKMRQNWEVERLQANQDFKEAAEELEKAKREFAEVEAKHKEFMKSANRMKKVTIVMASFMILYIPSFVLMVVLSIWKEGMWTYIDGVNAMANFVVVLYMMYINYFLSERGSWKTMRKIQVLFWLALLFNMGCVARYLIITF